MEIHLLQVYGSLVSKSTKGLAFNQQLFLVPLIGGRYHDNHPIGNIQVVYKWYILPIGDLYITYHLLREPGNSIDNVGRESN